MRLNIDFGDTRPIYLFEGQKLPIVPTFGDTFEHVYTGPKRWIYSGPNGVHLRILPGDLLCYRLGLHSKNVYTSDVHLQVNGVVRRESIGHYIPSSVQGFDANGPFFQDPKAGIIHFEAILYGGLQTTVSDECRAVAWLERQIPAGKFFSVRLQPEKRSFYTTPCEFKFGRVEMHRRFAPHPEIVSAKQFAGCCYFDGEFFSTSKPADYKEASEMFAANLERKRNATREQVFAPKKWPFVKPNFVSHATIQ